ncbi:MAG: tRNA-dihydrouridine synthase, partial [Peptostreptococcaceae bacterium]
ATLGNPFLFNEINEYLNNNIIIEKPCYKAIYETIKRHLNYLSDFKDEYITMLEMRRQIGYYIKGLPHASKIKPLIFKTKTIEETMSLVDDYFKQLIEEKNRGCKEILL